MKKFFLLILLFFCFTTRLFAGGIIQPVTAGSTPIIALVDSDAAGTASGGDAFALPTITAAEGDFMVACIVDDSTTQSAYALAGWTEFTGSPIYDSAHTLSCFYKEAGAAESGPYDFDTASGGDNYVAGFIASFSKTSGTWDPDQDYSETNGSASATITTSSVTVTENGLLICAFGNDGGKTVSTPPASPAALLGTNSQASVAIAGYYQLPSAGAITKSIVWSDVDEMTAIAIVVDTVP